MAATAEKMTARERNANWLGSIAAQIKENEAKAINNQREALAYYREIGALLNDAKETLKDERGAFGAWCDDMGFTFARTWRARLMKLAAHWDEIEAVLAAHPDQTKVWSVDAALAAWKAANKPEGDAADAGEAGEGEGSSGASANDNGPKPGSKADLERQLAEALEKITRLEAENAKLKADLKGKAEAGKADAGKAETKAKAESAPKGKVDAQTKARAKKVHALWKRPGTKGEGDAAKGKLDEMAAKFGLSFEDFLAACGLEL